MARHVLPRELTHRTVTRGQGSQVTQSAVFWSHRVTCRNFLRDQSPECPLGSEVTGHAATYRDVPRGQKSLSPHSWRGARRVEVTVGAGPY